jgi:hypothetical protein
MSEVSRTVGNGCRIPTLKAGDMVLPLCGEEHSDPLGVPPTLTGWSPFFFWDSAIKNN